MAEIAGTVIGIASVGIKVIKTLHDAAYDMVCARKDIFRMHKRVKQLTSTLHHLTRVLQMDQAYCTENMLHDIRRISRSCKYALREIRRKTSSQTPSPLMAFRWLFMKSKALELEAQLSADKSTLELMIQTVSLAKLGDIRSKSEKDGQTIDTIVEEITLMKATFVECCKKVSKLQFAEQRCEAEQKNTALHSDQQLFIPNVVQPDAQSNVIDMHATNRESTLDVHPRRSNSDDDDDDDVEDESADGDPGADSRQAKLAAQGSPQLNLDVPDQLNGGELVLLPRNSSMTVAIENNALSKTPRIEPTSNMLLNMISFKSKSNLSLLDPSKEIVSCAINMSQDHTAAATIQVLMDKWTTIGSKPISDALVLSASRDQRAREHPVKTQTQDDTSAYPGQPHLGCFLDDSSDDDSPSFGPRAYDSSYMPYNLPQFMFPPGSQRFDPPSPYGPHFPYIPPYSGVPYMPGAFPKPRPSSNNDSIGQPCSTKSKPLKTRDVWRDMWADVDSDVQIPSGQVGDEILHELYLTGGDITYQKLRKYSVSLYVGSLEFYKYDLVPSCLVSSENDEVQSVQIGRTWVREKALELLGYKYEKTESSYFYVRGDLSFNRITELVKLSYQVRYRKLETEAKTIIEQRGWLEAVEKLTKRPSYNIRANASYHPEPPSRHSEVLIPSSTGPEKGGKIETNDSGLRATDPSSDTSESTQARHMPKQVRALKDPEEVTKGEVSESRERRFILPNRQGLESTSPTNTNRVSGVGSTATEQKMQGQKMSPIIEPDSSQRKYERKPWNRHSSDRSLEHPRIQRKWRAVLEKIEAERNMKATKNMYRAPTVTEVSDEADLVHVKRSTGGRPRRGRRNVKASDDDDDDDLVQIGRS